MAKMRAEIMINIAQLRGNRWEYTVLVDNWETYSGTAIGGPQTVIKMVNDFFQRRCRVCGCSFFDPCHGADGGACSWTAPDLCSFCVGKPIPLLPGGAS